ncbi:MAG: hypothetical protein ACRCYQ_00845, partial [Nocardioides sp.]
GLTADIALETVEDLRSAIPDALARAVASLPTDVQPSASRMAEQIIKHASGSWRPTEPSRAGRFAPLAQPATTPGEQGRVRKSLPTGGRFTARDRAEPDVQL